MVEEAQYPKFISPKTVSFKEPVDRGKGHRPGIEITAEVTSEEMVRVKEYYKRPDYLTEGDPQEEELLKSLVQKRRLGVAEYARMRGTSLLFAFTVDSEEIPWEIPPNMTQEAYIAEITEAVEESQKKNKESAPKNKEEFLEREAIRYRAIGFAEAAWLNKDFIRALEAYRAAQWLDSDVPAAKAIPQKLERVLLEPYLKTSEEETKIVGRDEKGRGVIQKITPTERMEKILAIRDRLEEWGRENELTPTMKAHFSKFLELNKETLNNDYQQAKLLELSRELFVPEKEDPHEAQMAGYGIREQLKQRVIPVGEGLENLKKAFGSLDPNSLAMGYLKEGIREYLAGREPELAIAIISEGVNSTTIKNWHLHIHSLEELIKKYDKDPELGGKIKTLVEKVLLSALVKRIGAGELNTSARAKAFIDVFNRTKGSESRPLLPILRGIEANLAAAEEKARFLLNLIKQTGM